MAWHRTTEVCARHELPAEVVAELAERGDWTLPADVTLVIMRKGARVLRTALADDVLADLGDEPRLLLPGELTPARRAMLEAAVPRDPIVVGVTVPSAEAADSLRWARRAVALVADGVIESGRVTLREDHLLTL